MCSEIKLQEACAVPKLSFIIPYVGEIIMGIIIDIIFYIKRQSRMAQIELENISTEETSRTLHDLPGIDFPIKASLSANLLSIISVMISVPFLTKSEISTGHFTSYFFLLHILTYAISIPLLILLSFQYNEKCNARDRQYCNSREWDYELQTRENQQSMGVSHTSLIQSIST